MNKSGIEIFENIKNVSSLKEFLQSTKNLSERGKVFEIVSNMIIRFGFCAIFTNDDYDHYEGNINTCRLKKVENLELYLKKLTSSKSGSSDITLQNKITKEYIFISCKFSLDDSNNNIKYYEIQNIHSAILKNNYKYKKYKIYLFVNNKQKVQELINSSEETNKHLKNDIEDIIDIDQLEIYFENLKRAIQNVSINELNTKFNINKIPLELRFHQDLITHKLLKKINEGEQNFLLGAKARSGKTYCVGGLFIKYYNKYKKLNSLIITPAPTETLTQFTDDLFHKFRDFMYINIVEIKRSSDFDKIRLENNNIIIISKQLLDGYVFEKTILPIKNLNLDFIVFDENHFHGTTQMSKNILQSYLSLKTIKVYLTATYAKPLNEWNVSEDCQFYWDIEDEQMCKKRNINGLIDKHGNDVSLFVKPENQDYILSIYDRMPDLHIITNMMDIERYEIIKERIKDTTYGFSNRTLLSTTEDGNNFNYTEEVDNILKYISGNDNVGETIRDKKSIFERIKYISNYTNSRTRLNNGDFSSQLWFLPFGKDMLIDNVSKCLKNRMIKNKTLCNYEIMIVNSKKDFKLKDIKEEIKNAEFKAKEFGKSGLIILAGNQLTLGITLPFVDIVFLFNDVLSSDKILQMMYRCMTESINSDENNLINNSAKKIGFVVDLNISRVLNTMLDYNIHKKDLSIEQKIEYLINNNLINIDNDLFEYKENKTKLIEKLLNIWKLDPINNLKILLKKIEENIIDLDSKDQKLINQYFTNSVSDTKFNVKIHFDDDQNGTLKSGKEIIKYNTMENETYLVEDNIDTTDEIINISLTKDILPFIIPLSCILTIHDNKYDFAEILNVIKVNSNLLDIFNDQSFIWWNKTDIILLIKTIVDKYVKRNSSIYDITIQFKMSLQSLIDKPKELLELINNCLKPKQKEKQENGEVFTPMDIIFEMLNNLDEHYIKENGRSIFTEKNFKWGDIAGCGMGNFSIAIYLKLMEGLKNIFLDENERKKHILENMIYMAELNKKNIFICRQIFDINNIYNLNIYEGDTLLLNTKKEWDLEYFDIIVGNPPYNKGGIRSHTGKQLGKKNETIWTKFINKSFELLKSGGYLVFINPLSWLKKSHSLHNDILEKYVVWLILWDNSQSKALINADIPISLYIIKNNINEFKQKSKIISILKRRNLKSLSFEYIDQKYSVPLAYHNIFNKLINFIETNNLQLDYKTKTIKSIGIKSKIPNIFTPEDMWAIDTYTIKDGIIVKKCTEKHPDLYKNKLIIANKASFNGAFIDYGQLNLTGNHKFYILGNNLELLLHLLSFKIIDIISQYTKYGQDFLDNEAFKYIPDIRKLGITDINEDEFYNLIGLTSQEIDQITK